MAEGKFAEACPKFAESYRLDPATGTLLNLASCHEGEHKVATAWLEFTEAVASAKRDHRDDRVKFAEEHLAAIEPKLSRLSVTVASDADIAELKVQVDGVVVLAAARGIPTPVDPGEHVIEATAPGRKSWSQRIKVGEQAQSLTVTVPLLPAEAAQPATPPPPVTPPPIAPGVETVSRPIPTSVYVAGGATIALAIGASITGGVYMSHRSSDGTSQVDPAYSRNVRWGGAATILIGGAVVGSGVTAYLYLTRPSQTSKSGAVSLSPWASTSGGGLVLGGSL
jgi:hypothetical protein